jgi:hypothetical protein
MKKSWYKLLVSLVLVGLLVAPTGLMVQAGEGEPPERCASCSDVGGPQQTVRLLPSNDPLVRELSDTEDAREVLHNFGALQWDQATAITYEGSERQVLAVPIRSKTDESQVLLAEIRDGKEFVVLVLGVTYDGNTLTDHPTGFTGTLNFYNPTGELAITATFVEGELQNVEKLAALRSPGLNWDCFTDCLLHLGLQFGSECIWLCYYCAGFFHPYNPACWGCAACIGGGAFWCIVACWE